MRKMELIKAVRASRSYLLKVIEDLSPDEIMQPATIGKCCVKDVLSHIAGWDIWMSTTMQTILGGNQPDLSAPLDVVVANAIFVKERAASIRMRRSFLGLGGCSPKLLVL